MTSALLILTLLAAEEVPSPPESDPELADRWAGEERRVHYGIGGRIHGGLVNTQAVPLRPLAMSEFTFFVSIRVFGHHEWRVGVGIAAGWPDTLAGETNVSFRFHLNPRFSIGVGAFTYLGFWSMRAGLEVPIAVRLGKNRRHELSLSLRGFAGAYNDTVTLVWYDFNGLRPARGFDAVLGYSLFF